MKISELIAAARREANLRMKVYEYRIRDRKMTREQADHEIGAMNLIVVTLTGLAKIPSAIAQIEATELIRFTPEDPKQLSLFD